MAYYWKCLRARTHTHTHAYLNDLRKMSPHESQLKTRLRAQGGDSVQYDACLIWENITSIRTATFTCLEVRSRRLFTAISLTHHFSLLPEQTLLYCLHNKITKKYVLFCFSFLFFFRIQYSFLAVFLAHAVVSHLFPLQLFCCLFPLQFKSDTNLCTHRKFARLWRIC